MKKTIIKDLHADLETGIIHILLHKRALDEQGNVIAQGNHRMMIYPDTDIDAMAAAINDHLASGQVPINNEVSGKAVPVALAEWEAVRAHAKVAHTPAIMKAWNKQKEARLAEEKIRHKAAKDDAEKLDSAVAAALQKAK